MDSNLLVLILSVLVFILGALFINFTVKREEKKKEEAERKAAAAQQKSTN